MYFLLEACHPTLMLNNKSESLFGEVEPSVSAFNNLVQFFSMPLWRASYINQGVTLIHIILGLKRKHVLGSLQHWKHAQS